MSRKVKYATVLDVDYSIFFDEENDKRKSPSIELEQPAWETLVESDDRQLINQFEDDTNDKAMALMERGDDVIRILLTGLVNTNTTENLYYISNLLFFTVKEYRADVVPIFERLYRVEAADHILPFGHILTALNRNKDDFFIVSKLLTIATFLAMNIPQVDMEDVNSIFSFCKGRLENLETDDKIKLVVLTNISVLIKKKEYRAFFEENRRIIKILIKHTDYKPKMNEQILYQTLNILWILTFNENIKKRLTLTKKTLVRNLCYILHVVGKVKIIRLSLALLRNLLHEGDNGEVMIASGIMETLRNLHSRREQFNDEDMNEDMDYLETNLEPIMNAMSSFDRFRHEILSEKLDPTSPVHKSERFWRENFSKFEDHDYDVLRKLIEIINNMDNDPKELALACWDIGEFVRFHPRGKAIIDKIEGKIPIMKLLEHESEKVKGESLLALQKLMVTNWEYLQQ